MVNDESTAREQYAFWVKMASRASIFVASLLMLSKLYAWLLSDSAAMLSSLTDSLLDVFASIMNFVILRYALMPADDDHRFGHGKAESLAGLVQASFILGSSVLLLLHGVSRTITPKAVENSEIAIGVTIFAFCLTLGLVTFQRFIINKTQSVAISADSLHYQSDLLLNAGVLAALLFSQYLWLGADGLFTVLVGFYLAYGAIKIAMTSVHHLMDKELSLAQQQQIVEVANKHPSVYGIHDLRTRQSGVTKFVQFHLELDDSLSLYQAHQITEEVEQAVAELFEDVEVFIHQDPQSLVEPNPQ